MARTNKELLTITQQLMAIESTAENHAGLTKAYDLIVSMLLSSGKKITVEHFENDGAPSLLAYMGPQRPDNFRVIFNAHLDVVPAHASQFKPVIKNGKLYGRGSYDMKAAAIIMADAFCEYVDQVPYALGLQVGTDEENAGWRGTGYQVAQGVRADFVVCGECGRLPGTYEIANEAKGICVVDVEFGGTSSHGAYLWRGKNAILEATTFAHKILERYPTPVEEVHHTTMNISSIGTNNTAFSQVPDHAMLRLDMRFTADDPHFRSKQHVAALIEEIDPQAKISRFHSFEAPVYSSPQNPLLLQLKAAAEITENHPFVYVRRHATSDGRFFASVGDQACEFGIAGVNQHGENEHITLEAFDNYRKTMRAFLEGTKVHEAEHTNTIAYRSA